MIQLLVLGSLVAVGAIIVLRSIGRQRVLRVWNPTLLAWRTLRLVTLVFIFAALWLSGRLVLQAIAVAGVAFVGVYLWIEKPHEPLIDEAQSRT